jgi:hypothetical protein
MSEERTRKLRRPKRVVLNGRPSGRGKTGIVPRGTKGIYDADPVVASATARAMVNARDTTTFSCQAPGCIDPTTGQPRTFRSRLVNGEPERKACSASHRLKLWRMKMEQLGDKQRTIDGVVGWLTPEGVFHPNPSQPRRRTHAARARRVVQNSRTTPEGTESG